MFCLYVYNDICETLIYESSTDQRTEGSLLAYGVQNILYSVLLMLNYLEWFSVIRLDILCALVLYALEDYILASFRM